MNATRGTFVLLVALAPLAVACDLDKGPIAPRASLRADQVAAAVSSFVCDVGGATWEGDPDAAVLHDLAPSGVMRVALNYNNRTNAARNPSTGALTGPGIDMSCKLSEGTHAQFVAVPYLGVPPLLAGLANGDWDAAFAFDQTLEPPGITAAIPHVGVDNTYLVRGDAPFQKVADVDAPGVRISVAEGSSGDIFLGRTLGVRDAGAHARNSPSAGPVAHRAGGCVGRGSGATGDRLHCLLWWAAAARQLPHGQPRRRGAGYRNTSHRRRAPIHQRIRGLGEDVGPRSRGDRSRPTGRHPRYSSPAAVGADCVSPASCRTSGRKRRAHGRSGQRVDGQARRRAGEARCGGD